MKILYIFIVSAFCIFFVTACSGGLFDELEVYSAREHLADQAKGGDLLQAMDKTGISKIVLAGSYNNTFNPSEPINWNSSIENNQLLLDALARVPGRLIIFPLIRGDEPDFDHYFRDLVVRGARGFILTNGLESQRRMPLTDPRLQSFYEWCEINHLPVLIDIELEKYGAELEDVLREYPHLTVIGGCFLRLLNDLPRLSKFLLRYHNLYLDFSFGWDADKRQAFETMSARREEFRRFLNDRFDRVLWGTQIIIARDAGRNVDWLTQYIFDSRYFIEHASAKMKFATHGKSELVTLAGLDLARRELAHFYNLNFKRVLDDQPPAVEKYDLNKLLVGIPPKAEYDKNGPYRLMLTCATSMTNAVEGIFSARLKNALTGTLTSWREINGIDRPIEIVTIAPFDQWLPMLFGLDKTIPLRVMPNAGAVRQYLAANPAALAFLAFADIEPGIRVLSIDGENPTTSYIRDCARRGGGLIGNYFHNYPLLVPLKSEQPAPAGLVFDPHQLTRVLLADRLLPASRPTGPAVESELDPYAESLFKITPYFQSADLTASVLDLPLREPCAAPGKDCLDAAWLNAFDYVGLDMLALAPALARQAEDVGPTVTQLRDHHLSALVASEEPAAPLVTRGHSFDLLAVDVDQPDRLPAVAARLTADAKAGTVGLVYLFTPKPDTKALTIAGELRAKGATAVILAGKFPPQRISVDETGFIAGGLGDVSALSEKSLGANPAVIAVLSFYRGRLRNVDFLPTRIQGEKLTPLYGEEMSKAYEMLFPR